MQRNRYSDNDNHDLPEDPEDFGDFYETQPGDSISRTTKHRRSKKKGILALAFLTAGTVLILVGIGYAMIGGEEAGGNKRGGFFPGSAPTEAPGEGTDSPTHSSMRGFLTELVGSEALLDPSSIANKAMAWMEDEKFNSIDRFKNHRLRQRFALACLFVSTNQESTWVNEDLWMSADSECTWYGVKCKNHRLISLNLTANGLEGFVPWEITYLNDDLLALDLSRNEIVNKGEELAWIEELDKLRKFRLSHILRVSRPAC